MAWYAWEQRQPILYETWCCLSSSIAWEPRHPYRTGVSERLRWNPCFYWMSCKRSTNGFHAVFGWEWLQWISPFLWNGTRKPHCLLSGRYCIPSAKTRCALRLEFLPVWFFLLNQVRKEYHRHATSCWGLGPFYCKGTSSYKVLDRLSLFAPCISAHRVYSDMTLVVNMNCVVGELNQETAVRCPRSTNISPLPRPMHPLTSSWDGCWGF